jgi:hypothetical protein
VKYKSLFVIMNNDFHFVEALRANFDFFCDVGLLWVSFASCPCIGGNA